MEDQQKKIKDREKKLKAVPSSNLDGKLIGNQMRSLTAAAPKVDDSWRPGFVAAIKWRSSQTGFSLSVPQGIMLPEVLRQPSEDTARATMAQRE